MNLLEAIDKRCSRRNFLDTPVDENKVQELNGYIKKYNDLGNLNMRLVINDGRPFGSKKGEAKNYIMLAASAYGREERCGYFGEKLVLEATRLGLGTCWKAGFDRNSCPFDAGTGEKLYCLIALGNVSGNMTLKEKMVRGAMHIKNKKAEEMFKSSETVPTWFINGMECVKKAPSAINRQPVVFRFDGGNVTASVVDFSGYRAFDLGIAKLHFEIGAGFGSWEFGNGGKFIYGDVKTKVIKSN